MPDPELILTAKSILTMNPAQPRAESIAIRDGRIHAVGSRNDVGSLAGPGTERVDLGFEVRIAELESGKFWK